MDEDREKGRIVSLTIRRQKMAEHARSMVPVLAAARSEITGGMQQPVSLRTYADWLNRNDYKTAQDKVWRAQTVARLLDVDQSLREQANAVRKRSRAVLAFRYRLLSPADRRDQQTALEDSRKAVEDDYRHALEDAVALKAALLGHQS